MKLQPFTLVWLGLALFAPACVIKSGGQPAGPETTASAPTATDGGSGGSAATAKVAASTQSMKSATTPPRTTSTTPRGTSTQPEDAAVRRDASGARLPAGDAARADDDDAAQDNTNASAAPAFASPCPAKSTPCRIMPLGDSNTAGWLSSDDAGYRTQLFRRTLQAQQTITFVGQQSSGPTTLDGVDFPRANEGYLGATISEGGGRSGLQQLAVSHIQTEKPDIVLLMIGTNDVDIELDLPNAPARLGSLIDAVFGSFSGLLVVAKIPPTTHDDENVRVSAYNAALPAVIKARVNDGKHILLVDVYSAIASDPKFKETLMADGLHPNDAGYVIVGNVWYEALKQYLH